MPLRLIVPGIAGLALITMASVAYSGSSADTVAYDAKPPQNLAYPQNPLYAGTDAAIAPDYPVIIGGKIRSYSVSPALPAGLTLDATTGVISGTPRSVAALRNYVVAGKNYAGTVSANVAVAVARTTPPDLHPRQAFIGNTLPGAVEANQYQPNYVPMDVDAIDVRPDGAIYTNAYYDEGGENAVVLNNGGLKAAMQALHGWARYGGHAVAANNTYVFVAITQHGRYAKRGYPHTACGTFYGFRRYHLDGSFAPYITQADPQYRDEDGEAGQTVTTSESIQDPNITSPTSDQCRSLVADGGALLQKGTQVNGLAVYGTKLYVSDYDARTVRVFDTESLHEDTSATIHMERPRSTVASHPWELALDHTGSTLWVAQRDIDPKVHSVVVPYAVRGPRYGRITRTPIFDVQDASAITCDRSGRYLAVADDAPTAQQVYVYDLGGAAATGMPRRVNRIGVAGGPFHAGAARYGFDSGTTFNRIVGLGVDGYNNLFVATNGHGIDRDGTYNEYSSFYAGYTLIQAYRLNPALGLADPKPRLGWDYHDWVFVDNFGFAGRDLYSKYQEYHTDGKVLPSGELQLKHVAYTQDPERFTNDARISTFRAGTWVQDVHGHRFVYISSQQPHRGLAVYREDHGVLRPTAFLFLTSEPAEWPRQYRHPGSWVWTDQNGDGNFSQNEFAVSRRGLTKSRTWAWSTDSNGDIWAVPEYPDKQSAAGFAFYHFKLRNIDANGVPHYDNVDQAEIVHDTFNGAFSRIERFHYNAVTDTAYISGYGPEDNFLWRDWGRVGTKIARFDHWLHTGARVPRWSVNLPYRLPLLKPWDPTNAPSSLPTSLAFAGKYIFVTYNTPTWVDVLHADNGEVAAQPIVPAKRFGGTFMLLDMPYGTNAATMPDGTTDLAVEEDARGKNMLYIFPK